MKRMASLCLSVMFLITVSVLAFSQVNVQEGDQADYITKNRTFNAEIVELLDDSPYPAAKIKFLDDRYSPPIERTLAWVRYTDGSPGSLLPGWREKRPNRKPNPNAPKVAFQDWRAVPLITIATFDLECSSLNADFGIVLCGVIKPHYPDSKPVVLRGDLLCENWDTCRSDDKKTVETIANALSAFDILIAHNGLKYDLPFLRTRLAKHGLPPLKDFKLVDPVQIARNKLRMSNNSLDRITDFLGCNSKTTVDGDTWLKASLDGDRAAMDYIAEHCVEDVYMLEKIVDAVKGYCSVFNNRGSSF